MFPWGISIRVIRVEICGSGRKQKCSLLWPIYIQSNVVVSFELKKPEPKFPPLLGERLGNSSMISSKLMLSTEVYRFCVGCKTPLDRYGILRHSSDMFNYMLNFGF